jgi:ADP-ribose pyrophosphatase YjhB (NUDIX family)
MKLLKEISDGMFGDTETEILGKKYELRKSARAILINDEGDIAIQYLANHFFHKLPGGGVETGETIAEALVREVKEEVGCDSEIIKEIGIVIEYRKEHTLLHMSYCYLARVVGLVSESTLEQAEIDEGMSTIWMKPEIAIQKMETDVPNTYQGKFILERELAFLREFVGMR